MAYPNYYYPASYQQYMPNQMQLQQQFQQMQPTQATQQPQTTGFIRVPHEDVARNWNVPPGMSFTFIDENAPYCYIKTAGMSQLDRPKFEKYRMVKEEDTPSQPVEAPTLKQKSVEGSNPEKPQYALKTDLNALQGHFNALEQRYIALEHNFKELMEGKSHGEPADFQKHEPGSDSKT